MRSIRKIKKLAKKALNTNSVTFNNYMSIVEKKNQLQGLGEFIQLRPSNVWQLKYTALNSIAQYGIESLFYKSENRKTI